ncbi:peptide/nickel transport system ATP-binding protein [Micromonospora polyrhachis]|uniref:Peptide/nickel transport system ATP-binding protein n=2 Tax=Micromonospora polyrhachis TaxID=1282883 RepID=A0A7W7WQ93_9ACTN|nr:ABC transporter ATP-binding protein [Micromonospora polyrhachis]MBB4960046.1 peptide/nickel transport system ATP-binding protein [Micromonospora polyrhachis]
MGMPASADSGEPDVQPPNKGTTPRQRTAEDPYLRVNDLKVHFDTEDGVVRAVDGVSFSVERGQTLGIVGESGSGKSVTSLAILGLHNARRTTITGQIQVGGQELVGMPEHEIRKLRGRDLSMIFQDPLSALHPYYTVGRQIAEAYRIHHPEANKRGARQRAIDMLGRVGIPQPAKRVDQYPHEFSGGMRQRAMIAMSLVNDPALVIADEPTTALDVTVQAQILDLLEDLQAEFNSAIIMITHDLGVVSQVADEVLVMYGGRAVERGSVEQVLRRPQHPYTWGLLSSVPSLHGDADADLVPIKGNPPSLINLPPGCAFHPRCRYAERTDGRSSTDVPELLPVREAGHLVACHLPEEERARIHADEIVQLGVAR